MKRIRELISETHRHGIAIARKIDEFLRRKHWLEKLNAQRRSELTHPFSPDIVMYDSIELDQFPAHPEAVAGYVNGKWPTFRALCVKFPKALKLSIAVTAEASADCLDVERGDATPADAPAWFLRQKLRNHTFKPWFYANRSTMPELIAHLTSAGIVRSGYRLWVADPTGVPHIPPGYEACQFDFKALGRNLDASLVKGGLL